MMKKLMVAMMVAMMMITVPMQVNAQGRKWFTVGRELTTETIVVEGQEINCWGYMASCNMFADVAANTFLEITPDAQSEVLGLVMGITPVENVMAQAYWFDQRGDFFVIFTMFENMAGDIYLMVGSYDEQTNETLFLFYELT